MHATLAEVAIPARVSPMPLAVQPCPEELVRQHGKLVQWIARQTFTRLSSTLPIEDLVQIGQIALIEASRAFVDRGDAAFSTYATLRIRGAMIDTLRRSATITRDAIQRRRQFAQARQALETTLYRPATDKEMACHVNMAVGTYQAAHAATNGIHFSSMDESYSDHDISFADQCPDAFTILDKTQQQVLLAKAIKTLSEREQIIMQLYYVDEVSLEEIGKIFDVGAARVCQIKKGALAKLHRQLNGRIDRN